MADIPFVKMHGLGNDFVVITQDLPAAQIRQIADRRYGVGCDQVLVKSAAQDPDADFFMHIYNPDGSEAGACGNGTRCVAALYMDETGRDHCTVQTRAGLLHCQRAAQDGHIQVDMGVPQYGWQAIPLARELDTLALTGLSGNLPPAVAVNMGNPHAVFFVDDLAAVALPEQGPAIENHSLFPERTNVEFAQILDEDRIRVRVWERGAGITQACGSGACAVCVAAIRRGLVPGRSVEIILEGGALAIEWRADDGHILMSGPAVQVFSGVYPARPAADS